jgi:tetratricopeptide (TPR) repeat protein
LRGWSRPCARGDHQGALDALDHAVDLDPNFSRARAQKANELVMAGRPKEAPPLMLKAIAPSPRNPVLVCGYLLLEPRSGSKEEMDNMTTEPGASITAYGQLKETLQSESADDAD